MRKEKIFGVLELLRNNLFYCNLIILAATASLVLVVALRLSHSPRSLFRLKFSNFVTKNYRATILLFLAAVWLVNTNVQAQTETSQNETQEQNPVVFDGDRIEYSEEHKMVHGFGNVIISHENMTMTADKIAFDVESKEAVAEGNVSLKKDETVFKGKYGHYDFNTEKGLVSDVTFLSPPVYGAAEEAEKVAEKTYVAQNGYFGTCPFKKPHYRIQSKSLRIYLDDKIVANHVIFYIMDTPFLYLPYYSYSLKENRPRVTVTPGHSKEWGSYVLSGWRYRFDDNSMGRIHLDCREKQGVAEGFTHTYKPKNLGEGTLHAYYMQERLRDIPEGTKAENERFRIKWLHEWQPDDNNRTFLEYHRQGDIDFNKDFFYREYVKDPQPKTQFSYTKKFPYYTVNFYNRVRVNQFETVIQEQPRAAFNMSGYQLGGTKFYYTNETGFANFNKKTANAGLSNGNSYFYTTDTETMRLDTYNKLAYPTKAPGYFKWLRFTPYVDTRESFYTRSLDGAKRDFFRNVYGSGYNLTTKVFRMWYMEKDLMGIKINKLRHLITPNIDYGYVHDPTVSAEKLDAFDYIDAITSSKVYTFRLNHKLQTKWITETGDLQMINLVDFDGWIYLYPRRETRNFSDLFFSLKIMPFRWLVSESSATYDWVTRDFEVFNFDLGVTKPSWEAGVGHKFVTNDYSETTFRALYKLTSKWQVGCYERYDFTRKRLNEQEYFFGRDIHDWIVEITWNVEKVGGESIMLVFRNKAFPDAPMGADVSYNEPKVGSQSEPLY